MRPALIASLGAGVLPFKNYSIPSRGPFGVIRELGAPLVHGRGMPFATAELPGFQHPTTGMPTPPSDHTPLRRRCAF
jgi:hypothetical protein